MSDHSTHARHSEHSGHSEHGERPSWPLALALTVVVIRATTLDALRDPFEVMPGTTAEAQGPLGAASLVLSAASLVAAAAVLHLKGLKRTALGAIALLAASLWMVLSTAWSGDAYASFVSGANYLSAAALMTTLVAYAHQARRVILGVLAGLLLAQLAFGAYFRTVEYPENRAYWAANKASILKQHGWTADHPRVLAMEKKQLAGEPLIFASSPNSFAAVIVAGSIAAIALVRGWGSGLAFLGVAAASVWMVWIAGTRVAVVTAALGVGVFAILKWGWGLVSEWPRVTLAAVTILVALVAATVVGVGLSRGDLIEKSLTMRWYYWTGAAELAADRPVVGWGQGNFGGPYLGVRAAKAVEEVKDPHNVFVKALVETGMVGLLLVAGWLLATGMDLLRPDRAEDDVSPPVNWKRLCIWASVFFLLLCWLVSDRTDNETYRAWLMIRRLAVAGLVCLGCWWVLRVKPGLRSMRVAAGAAFAVLLAHGMIDFALSEGSVLAWLPLLVAIASEGFAAGATLRRSVGVVTGVAAVGMVAVAGMALSGESDASLGDSELRAGQMVTAKTAYLSAHDSMPLESDYLYRAARAAMIGKDPEEAWRLLDLARSETPQQVSYALLGARYFGTLALGSDVARDRAIQCWTDATQLNPRRCELWAEAARSAAIMGDMPLATLWAKRAILADKDLAGEPDYRLPAPDREEMLRLSNRSLGGSPLSL